MTDGREARKKETGLQESTKNLAKMLGYENTEMAVHTYLYIRYITNYLYYMAAPAGLVDKPPTEQVSPELDEVLQMLARKVGKEALSAETSTYHGKVVPLKDAVGLVTVDEDIELRDLEKVVPYSVARDIVLENPLKIAVFECPCRLLHENPCEPLDVCMAVGDPIASFIVEHGLHNARMISSDEAVEILKAEHERGHVHGAYFKDVAGDRFFAICNCCSCCCMGVQAWNKFKLPIICSSGYVAEVTEECTACGDCVEACPFDAVTVDDVAVVDTLACMGCGVCEGACDFGAVRLVLDPSKGEPLDIKKLVEEQEG